MSYNTKNYEKQGGDEWHVGGKLIIDPGGQLIPLSPRGNVWFVDSTVTATGDGKSWDTAFKTITEAVAAASAGDTIKIWSGTGTANQFAESVTVTALAGITIEGGGTNPDQAVWTGLAGHALTFAGSADFTVRNIRFRPASGYAGISLTGASSYGIIEGNRFQGTTGSKYGILSDGQQSGVKVLGNDFMYMNAATCYGIYAPIYGTTAENSSWQISRNNFHSNTYHIKGNFRYSEISKNIFSGFGLLSTGAQGAPTKCLDLTPASGSVGNNQVTQNMFGGAYTAALYVSASATEDWIGNYCAITATTGTFGLTVAVPGA
jgi:hypothetical protein